MNIVHTDSSYHDYMNEIIGEEKQLSICFYTMNSPE